MKLVNVMYEHSVELTQNTTKFNDLLPPRPDSVNSILFKHQTSKITLYIAKGNESLGLHNSKGDWSNVKITCPSSKKPIGKKVSLNAQLQKRKNSLLTL